MRLPPGSTWAQDARGGQDIPKAGREGCGQWWVADIGYSSPIASFTFLSSDSVLKVVFGLFGFDVGLSIRKVLAHYLCSEYFGFYGSDFSSQINRLKFGLWFSFQYD